MNAWPAAKNEMSDTRARQPKKNGISFAIVAAAVLLAAWTPGSRTEASERSAPVALPAGWSGPEDASNTPHFSQTPVAALDGKGNVYI